MAKNRQFCLPSPWNPGQGSLKVIDFGNPLEFLDETYPAKTRGMGLLYGENFIIKVGVET